MSKPAVRREISAGCVVYRRHRGAVQVALIQPRGHDRWALPKGLIDPGESTTDAARREAAEETGLDGPVQDKIDTIKYTYTAKWETPPARIFKIVTFFLMEARGGDTRRHDDEVEQVRWFPIDEAIKAAAYRSEQEVLAKARGLIHASRGSGAS